MSDKPECGRCRFWQADDESEDQGICRRFPPVLSDLRLESLAAARSITTLEAIQESDAWEFPATRQYGWCGEFMATDAQSAPEPDDRLMLDIHVADYLGIPTSRVGKLVKANKIPHFKLPTGDIVFRGSQIKAWVQQFQASQEGTDAT